MRTSQPAYNKIDFFLKNDTSKTVDNKNIYILKNKHQYIGKMRCV